MAVKKKTPKKTAKAAKKPMKKAPKKAATRKTAKPTAKAAKAGKKAAKKSPAKKTPTIKKTAAKAARPAKSASVKPAAAKSTTGKSAGAKPMTTSSATGKKPAVDLQSFVTPLDDRLLVRISGSEKMTAGGLYIPDTVSDVSGNLQGQVVAVGRGHRGGKGHLRPMDVRVGDKVVFPEFAGSKIKILNEDLVILRESEVMGVVSK